MIIILMGVCGSGKTSVGECLAEKIGCPFRDADDFHPVSNKEKMSHGIPLTDEDRYPWLLSIRQYILEKNKSNLSVVVTCSALKRKYRDLLMSSEQVGFCDMLFVYLKGTETLLRSRLIGRSGHFMPMELLTSQLSIMEVPSSDENHITVDISSDVNSIASEILKNISSDKLNNGPTTP